MHLLIVRRLAKERVATEHVAVDSTLTPQSPVTLLGLRVHHKLSKRNGNPSVRLAQRLSDVLISLGKEHPAAPTYQQRRRQADHRDALQLITRHRGVGFLVHRRIQTFLKKADDRRQQS
ncbi:hypothetical protein [Micromonospora sp. NPDC005220]|uniref:hypothetical protein n=1 Tax=Micromonospora sp. NPDC005220 TaxID=3155589 RepID=UPI0033A31D19